MIEPIRTTTVLYTRKAPSDAMAVTVARTEKGYEKNAWILLIPALILFLPFGFELGPLAWGWMILMIAISVTAYRQGKRWAWYALWLVPLSAVWVMVPSNVSATAVLVFILSTLGLLLPVRKFFPAKQA